MRVSSGSVGLSVALATFFAAAAVVGINPPAKSLTTQRIAALPVSEQAAWLQYLERSARQLRESQQQFIAELRRAGAVKPLAVIPLPTPEGANANSVPLNKDAAWYAGSEAAHIGDVVLSFQTPEGGWSKNVDMSKDPRQPGEPYYAWADRTARMVIPGDFALADDVSWKFVGTIDNDATTTQLHFLAKLSAALGPDAGAKYRVGLLHGLDYLLGAQYPNGGWPQVWPLAGGYHDGVTFNDDAMIQVVELLDDTAHGQGEFASIPAAAREQAKASVARGVRCILATQIVVNGKPAVWAQQYDPLTLKPASARDYEMPALSSAESATILLYLMNLPDPTPQEMAAIRGAAAWFKKTAIYGQAFTGRQNPEGRELVATPGAGPVWARFYEIGTDRPLFGDRDQTVHDRLSEISLERRNGYDWYRPSPEKAVARYAEWSAARPQAR
jgi:PelA/Pel-15E family pectate lyase